LQVPAGSMRHFQKTVLATYGRLSQRRDRFCRQL